MEKFSIFYLCRGKSSINCVAVIHFELFMSTLSLFSVFLDEQRSFESSIKFEFRFCFTVLVNEIGCRVHHHVKQHTKKNLLYTQKTFVWRRYKLWHNFIEPKWRWIILGLSNSLWMLIGFLGRVKHSMCNLVKLMGSIWSKHWTILDFDPTEALYCLIILDSLSLFKHFVTFEWPVKKFLLND